MNHDYLVADFVHQIVISVWSYYYCYLNHNYLVVGFCPPNSCLCTVILLILELRLFGGGFCPPNTVFLGILYPAESCTLCRKSMNICSYLLLKSSTAFRVLMSKCVHQKKLNTLIYDMSGKFDHANYLT